jgi:HEAT repeat protein
MLDRNQLKAVGIRYARSLQMLFKTATMFSASHSAINAPLQHSFDLLNEIVKETRQFTVGFVDQRVMINNILTTERSLNSLENEFLKRGIGAVTFDAGITMAAYKRAIMVMAVQVRTIEEAGGLTTYLAQNPLEFVRIFQASKNQTRTDSGDTILEMDSESFLMAKALSDIRTPGLDKIDWFLQNSGMQGGGAGGVGGGSGPGGVPGGRSGSGATVSGVEGYAEGSGDGMGGVGGGPGVAGLGSGAGGFGPGSGGGGGVGGPGGGHGHVVAEGGPGLSAASGAPVGITNIVESYFNASMAESPDGQQRSYVELARIISETRPEFVLSSFPPKRRDELRRLPPDQMAAEVIEDTAVKWAAERLVSAPTGAEAVIVEEEVIRVLLRSLQATQAATRLARKLAEYFKDFNIPQATFNRVQEELEWVVVPFKEKTERLLELKHMTGPEFRRFLVHVTDVMKAGDNDLAAQLADHYMSFLDLDTEPTPEEFARVPELMAVIAGVRSNFWKKSAERLTIALHKYAAREFLHFQTVNAMVAICHTVAKFEEFDLVDNIGSSLEAVLVKDADRHRQCCGVAVANLLTVHAVDRVLEIFLYKRDDRGWSKTAASVLRRSGTPGIAKVFRALEDEPNTANRLALIRLIGRIGGPALELARESIKDDRWYVVRNACKLLSDLKDPDLLNQLAPALRHPDERVQKAAATAIMETRMPARCAVFADALPFLHPQVMEEVLGELLFLRDPVCLPALERLIFQDVRGTRLLLTCVQTLAAIPGPTAEKLLIRVLTESSMEMPARRMALSALTRSQSSEIDVVLRNFARSSNDPMAAEAAKALQNLGR